MDKVKLLIVEDEFLVAANLQADMEAMGYRVSGLSSSGEQALEMARRERPDLVLMDIKLRGVMDGVETALCLRRELDIPVVFITAFADDAFLERARASEPLGYLVKPFGKRELRAVIEMAWYKARMERRLRESELRFRTLFAYSPVAYQSLDESGCYVDVNPRLCELLGYRSEELLGTSFAELLACEAREGFAEAFNRFKEEGSLRAELQVKPKSGDPLTVQLEGRIECDLHGRFVRTHCVLYDFTERKRAEEERRRLEQRLQQAQKMESLARMAGAIAHRFNNLLGAVMGNLEMALEDLPEGSRPRENIIQAMKASFRAVETSRFMLTYLGRTVEKRVVFDLAEACRKALPPMEPLVSKRLRLRTDFPQPGPTILGEAEQIGQVVTNLVSNAAEAIGAEAGEIVLAVRVVSAEEIPQARFFPSDWEPQAERYACLAVSDTGSGLDAATLEEMFDPFFSTRFPGRGLGLSVVLGVVRAHEGAIRVESRLGRGTTLHLFFPLAEASLASPEQEAAAGAVAHGAVLAEEGGALEDRPFPKA